MITYSHTHYYLGFNLVPGIGPTRLARLIDQCGSVAAAWHARPADLLAAGLDGKSSTALLTARRNLDLGAEMERVNRAGVQLLTIEDRTYPQLLAQAPAPPPLLYVRGTLTSADDWSIAVVGTRSPTSYGKEVARRLVTELVANGISIISGLAIGIDTIVHRAALEAGGRTIAVLGSGVDQVYPERNQRLADQIMDQSALISEYPLGTRPVAGNFPPRNRIISGLSLGTVVVEAGERSGALITVDFALEQGRDVFAVPGSIFSGKSAGCHRLLRDGAGVVTCAQDVLDALNLTTASVQQEVAAILPDDPTEKALLELLSAEPQHADALGRACNLPAASVAAILVMLELKGYVRQVGHMEYVLVREAGVVYGR